jgi:ribosomal protein S12
MATRIDSVPPEVKRPTAPDPCINCCDTPRKPTSAVHVQVRVRLINTTELITVCIH